MIYEEQFNSLMNELLRNEEIIGLYADTIDP